MLLSLKSNVSKGDKPYKFSNYFKENFSIKPNSTIKLKQAVLFRSPSLVKINTPLTFSFIADQATNLPIIYNTPIGEFTPENFAKALNNIVRESLYNQTGYLISFIFNETTKEFGYVVEAYNTPVINRLAVLNWSIDPVFNLDVDTTNNILKKTPISKSLLDNYVIYQRTIDTSLYTLNDPPDVHSTDFNITGGPAVNNGILRFSVEDFVSGFEVSIVPEDFDVSIDNPRQYCSIIVDETRDVYIYEQGTNWYNPTQSSRKKINIGRVFTIQIPQYVDGAFDLEPKSQFMYIRMDTSTGGILFRSNNQAGFQDPTKRYRVEKDTRYKILVSLSEREEIITGQPPVYTYNYDKLGNFEASLLSIPPLEDVNLYSTPNFDNVQNCSFSNNGDGTQTITSDVSLSDDNENGAYESTLIKAHKGLIQDFKVNQANKEIVLGISDSTAPIYHPDSLTHGFYYKSDGSLNYIEKGVEGTLEPSYSTSDNWRLRIYESNFVSYEKSVDNGTNWISMRCSPDRVGDFPVHKLISLFPSSTLSNNASITLLKHSKETLKNSANAGTYLQFTMTEDLKNYMGFDSANYTWTLPPGVFPTQINSSQTLPYKINSGSYHVNIQNFPIRSYNGGTNGLMRTAGILPLVPSSELATSSSIITFHNYNYQIIKLNNAEPIESNKIDILITDPDGNTAENLDPDKNSELIFEITS